MGRVMVFNATFNNISVIPWRSVLLVEEIGVPAENHRLVASYGQTLSHNVVSSTPRMSVIPVWNTLVFRLFDKDISNIINILCTYKNR